MNTFDLPKPALPKFVRQHETRRNDAHGRIRAVARALADDLEQMMRHLPQELRGPIHHIYQRDVNRARELLAL